MVVVGAMGDGSGKQYNCRDAYRVEEKRDSGEYVGEGSRIRTPDDGRIS